MTKCNRRGGALQRAGAAALAAAVLLSACGGGGGGADTGGNNPGTTTGNQQLAFWAFENLAFRAVVVNGSTGVRTVLPQSGFIGVGSDSWSVRADGAEAVRLDARENITIFSTRTGTALGGFSLSALAGTSLPSAFTEPRLSPDGNHLLSYWRADSRDNNPVLVLWDRQGRLVAEDSPFNYDRNLYSAAVGWTPDGRAVYLAGTRIVALNPATGAHTQIGTVSLPVGVSTDNADALYISPDGTRLAVGLPTRAVSDSGLFTRVSRMIYVMNLDGSNLRQLTKVADRIRNGGLVFDMLNPVWSPDGTQLAATPRSSAPGCPRVKLLQADASAPVAVDDIFDTDSGYMQLTVGGVAQTVKDVCGVMAWWRT
jgi:hypothetical protein